MNQHSEQFWRGLLDTNLKFGLNIVDPRKWQLVSESAVTGNVKPVPDPLDFDVMDIEDFRKFRCDRF